MVRLDFIRNLPGFTKLYSEHKFQMLKKRKIPENEENEILKLYNILFSGVKLFYPASMQLYVTNTCLF